MDILVVEDEPLTAMDLMTALGVDAHEVPARRRPSPRP